MKSSKKERIEKLMKKYKGVSNYLLNSYSARVYTHADLDKLERLLEIGVKEVYIQGRKEGSLCFYDEEEGNIDIMTDFKNIGFKKWGGLPHFTSIRRALKTPGVKKSILYYETVWVDEAEFDRWNDKEYPITIYNGKSVVTTGYADRSNCDYTVVYYKPCNFPDEKIIQGIKSSYSYGLRRIVKYQEFTISDIMENPEIEGFRKEEIMYESEEDFSSVEIDPDFIEEM